MKMRMARPTALVDINFVEGLNGIQSHNGELRFGALARHADIEMSEAVAANSDSARLRGGNCGCAGAQSRDDWRIVGGSGSEWGLGRYAAYAGDFDLRARVRKGTNYQTGRFHQGRFYNCSWA